MSFRIVFVTYEFTYSTFSGNGILSRSLVQALTEAGVDVTVWCCRPHLGSNNQEVQQSEESWKCIPVTLPDHVAWKRIDRESGWEHFSFTSLCSTDREQLKQSISKANVVVAVDWTGACAIQTIEETILPRILYLNYRVFSQGVSDPNLQDWYNAKEANALRLADHVIAISRRDKETLVSLVEGTSIQILLPPLRRDIAELAHGANLESLPDKLLGLQSKCLLTCVVRLSPEKDALRFVSFVEGVKDLIEERKWKVVLAGARADPVYADLVEAKLRNVFPSAIILTDAFLSPANMISMYKLALLNFHPSQYDAYGMTIVEAAACGVPSVVCAEGVGALDLLNEDADCIRIEMPKNDSAYLSANSIEKIRAVLKDETKLEDIGKQAQRKAVGWNEQTCGKFLLQAMHDLAKSDILLR